ncbi:MAG: polysaccharide deacetylase family protein, partial [Paracoccaceae bacterium]
STLGAGRDFWWDALTRVFLTTPSLPDTLELTTPQGVQVWHLGAGAQCSAADLRLLAAARMPFDVRLHPRIRVMNQVRDAMFPALPDEIERLCTDVCAWAGVDRAGPSGDHPMTPEGLQRLAASGLVEIGAHTVSHRPLDLLAPDEALAEMAGSRKALREVIDREIRTIAYPYGRYSAAVTPVLAAEAGFDAACTTDEWIAIGPVNPFRFPRFTVRDWDGDQFARILRQFAGA